MRISDWSSDVCSSDLPVERRHLVLHEPGALVQDPVHHVGLGVAEPLQRGQLAERGDAVEHEPDVVEGRGVVSHGADTTGGDRKSVVEGKSVSVRVDLGGRRILKKKKNTKNLRN